MFPLRSTELILSFELCRTTLVSARSIALCRLASDVNKALCFMHETNTCLTASFKTAALQV